MRIDKENVMKAGIIGGDSCVRSDKDVIIQKRDRIKYLCYSAFFFMIIVGCFIILICTYL